MHTSLHPLPLIQHTLARAGVGVHISPLSSSPPCACRVALFVGLVFMPLWAVVLYDVAATPHPSPSPTSPSSRLHHGHHGPQHLQDSHSGLLTRRPRCSSTLFSCPSHAWCCTVQLPVSTVVPLLFLIRT